MCVNEQPLIFQNCFVVLSRLVSERVKGRFLGSDVSAGNVMLPANNGWSVPGIGPTAKGRQEP
jgi:hypothetical protein